MGVSRVLVVGGGITGSVAAIALAQRGVHVDLIEISEEWTSGAGHGITLHGNALLSFRKIGVWGNVLARGFAFDRLLMSRADGSLIADVPTPHTGGADLPSTLGSLRSTLQETLAAAVYAVGARVRLGLTVASWTQSPDGVEVAFSDGTSGRYDLVVGADGIHSRLRGYLGITTVPQPTGMSIWRVLGERTPDMDCAEVFYEGPRYKAGYSPISDTQCYAYILDEDVDTESVLRGRPAGAALLERSAGYSGRWGRIRSGITSGTAVNHTRIESLLVPEPWYRGRVIMIGDAVHACPPLIAQGAAMCTEDAVVLAELVTADDSLDSALKQFMHRRYRRVKMVVDNSLQLAEWEINPGTPGADPAAIMSSTLGALQGPP